MAKLISEQVAVMERTIKEQNQKIEMLENLLCKAVAEKNKTKARNNELKGLVLELIDRWWPLVHSVGISDTAKGLLKKATETLAK